MISGIKLRYWKSHERTELEFGPGTNMLIGQMGSGKTSVIEGICYALYGTTPALKSRRITLPEIIMVRPTGYTEAAAEVKFEAGGKTYSVERVIRHGEALAYLREAGKVIESGPQRVTETTEKLLKTDYELFTRAIYAEQNRVDAFLSLGKGERKKYFDELLGISRFEAARATAGTVLSRLKNLRNQTQAFLEGVDAGKLAGEQIELEKRVNELADAHGQASMQLSTLRTLQENISKQLTEWERKEREFRKLGVGKAGALSAKKEFAKLVLEAQKESGKRFSKDGWEKERERVESELAECERAEKALHAAQANAEKLEGESTQLSAELARFQPFAAFNPEDGERKLAELIAAERQLESELAASTQELSKANVALGRAQSLSAELSQVEKQLAEIIEQEKLAQEEQQSLPSIESARESRDRARQALAAVSGKKMQLADSKRMLSKADGTCPVCRSPLDDAHRTHVMTQWESEEKEVGVELPRAEKGMHESEHALERVNELSTRLLTLVEKAAAARKQAELIRSAHSSHSAQAGRAQTLAAHAVKLQGSLKQSGQEREKLAADVAGAREFNRLSGLSSRLAHAQKVALDEVKRLDGVYDDGKLKELREMRGRLDRVQQVFAWEAKINELDAQISKMDFELDALGFSEAELASSRNQSNECAAKLSDARVALTEIEAEWKDKGARLKEALARGQKAAGWQARLRETDLRIAGVSKLQNALGETQGALRSELVASLNEATASMWASIYPYGDYPGIRLTASEEDYSLELQAIDGTWMPVENASGGERMCAALCLRVALALVLAPQLGFLVLDEPTHNLDSAAVSMLSRALHDQLPRFIRQTFLITHDETLKEGASARVYRVERDKDAGDKSVVEEISIQ